MAMTREPIPDCPQPETPIRERAWSDAQRWQMFRCFLSEENDVFMSVFSDGTPKSPTQAQLDATCDSAINAAIAAGATP